MKYTISGTIFLTLFVINCKSKTITNISKEHISYTNAITEFKSIMNNEIDDTIKFKNFRELNAYFGKKFDSLSAKRKEFVESKIKNINLIDSLFFVLNYQKNLSSYYLVKTYHASEIDMRPMLYLIKEKSINTNEIEDLFKLFPEKVKKSSFAKFIQSQLEERIKIEENLLITEVLLKYSFLDPSGNLHKLENFKSKYLLLEFWASWCLPCRVDNRNLQSFLNDYTKEKKVTVLLISLDTNKEKWVKAIQEDKLEFINLNDFQGWNSKIVQDLNINSIPFNILLNSGKKIVGINLKGENFRKRLKELED